MRNLRLVSMVLAVSLGCGGVATGPDTGGDPSSKAGSNGAAGGGGAGGGGAGGGGAGGLGSSPAAVTGTYLIETQFNFLDALPPDVGNALKLALSFADSPGAFLLDEAKKIPVIKYVIDAIDIFSGVRNKVVNAINEYINGWSGGMVDTMHNIANDIEMALRGLRAHNKLVVTVPAPGRLQVDDTLVDLTFVYHGVDYPFPEGAHAVVQGATYSGFKFGVPSHTYDKGVAIGHMLVDLIDNIALPNLTGAMNLGELLNQLVNCGGVATWVWSYIANICIASQCVVDYLTMDDVTKLCQNGLSAVGNMIEGKIAALDAPGMISVSAATALMVSNHTKGHVDTVQMGVWSMTMPIGAGNLTLPGAFKGGTP